MKTVTLPIEEYNDLLKDQADKKRLLEELAKDDKDRGFFVQEILHMWCKNGYGWESDYENVREKEAIKIVSRDVVLADAQKEIERLSLLAQEYSAKIARLTAENFDLRHRGFFARLFNINKDADQ